MFFFTVQRFVWGIVQGTEAISRLKFYFHARWLSCGWFQWPGGYWQQPFRGMVVKAYLQRVRPRSFFARMLDLFSDHDNIGVWDFRWGRSWNVSLPSPASATQHWRSCFHCFKYRKWESVTRCDTIIEGPRRCVGPGMVYCYPFVGVNIITSPIPASGGQFLSGLISLRITWKYHQAFAKLLKNLSG